MASIKWEPVELALIEEVREQIESPKDNVRFVLEKLMDGMDLRPEIYHIKRILIGLTLLDSRQFYFYKVNINAGSILGIKDSQSDWAIKIHQTSGLSYSLRDDLKKVFNLDQSVINEIMERAV